MSLYIEKRGQGRSLVLLHGWGLHGGVFSDLAERLAGLYTLYIVDLPGHGRSAQQGPFDLTATSRAIAAAVPADACWLGWSLGGLVALAAAQAGTVGKLVLVAANPRFVATAGWPGTPAEILAGFAAELEADYRATLKRFIAIQTRGAEGAGEQARRLRQVLFARDEPDMSALRGGLAILRDSDLRPALAEITCPALVMGGERDTLVPPEALARTANALPAGRLELVEGAGHAPFLSHPERFEALLEEFFDG